MRGFPPKVLRNYCPAATTSAATDPVLRVGHNFRRSGTAGIQAVHKGSAIHGAVSVGPIVVGPGAKSAFRNCKRLLEIIDMNVLKGSLMAHDLAPTPSTVALLCLLRETLSGSSVVDEKPDQLQEIVSTIVDPLLESLQTVAAHFPPTDRDVFFLNSLYQG